MKKLNCDPNPSHTWQEGHWDQYQAFLCRKCEFLVLAVFDMPEDIPMGESVYLEDHRVIIVGAKKITTTECDALCKKHKAFCS